MKRLIGMAAMALVAMTMSAQQHTLWYDKPAAHWLEALPIGNSHLGAMVYGGTDVEEIQLNEETFWSGRPHSNNSQESLQALPEVRRLIFEGKEGQAAYRRELSLGNALATTSYIYNGVRYERTVFASQADNVIVLQLKAGKKGRLSFGIDFTSQLQSKVIPVVAKGGNGQANVLSATIDGVEQEGIEAGLKANCKVQIEADGKVDVKDGSIRVDDATTATLYIVAATNFVNYNDISGDGEKKNNQTLTSLQGKTYKQLLADHLKLAKTAGTANLPTSGWPPSTAATSTWCR